MKGVFVFASFFAASFPLLVLVALLGEEAAGAAGPAARALFRLTIDSCSQIDVGGRRRRRRLTCRLAGAFLYLYRSLFVPKQRRNGTAAGRTAAGRTAAGRTAAADRGGKSIPASQSQTISGVDRRAGEASRYWLLVVVVVVVVAFLSFPHFLPSSVGCKERERRRRRRRRRQARPKANASD